MIVPRSATFGSLFLLLGCRAPLFDPSSRPGTWMQPADAAGAVASHPDGVTGGFEMTVRSMTQGQGIREGHLFLHSAVDPREPGGLVIQLPPEVVEWFRSARRVEPLTDLFGKTVRVRGTAQPRRFIANPDRSDPGKDVLLTAGVRVDSPEQITLLADFKPTLLASPNSPPR